MIRVFSPNDKMFMSNGNSVIQPFKAKVHPEHLTLHKSVATWQKIRQ